VIFLIAALAVPPAIVLLVLGAFLLTILKGVP
jgi:hypothetical protein